MVSLLANKYPDTEYVVYVVCDGVDAARKGMIRSLGRDGFDVVVVECSNDYRKKDNELGKYISASTYVRLKLPSIFPRLGRLLYLDGDVIVQGDLGELYRLDLDGRPLAGVLDYGMCVDSLNWGAVDYIRNTMPTWRSEYINAGVLLMDLAALRRTGFEAECQRLYDERNDFIFADQDIVNFALIGKKKILPIYWNCPVMSFRLNYGMYSDDFIREQIRKTYHVAYGDVMELAFRSKILHANGDKRRMSEIPYLKATYDRYLDLALRHTEKGAT